MPIWLNCSLVMSRFGSSMNNCFSENMCNLVFRCARSSAGEPQRTLHNSHASVCGSVDLRERGGEGTKKKEGMKKRDKKRHEREGKEGKRLIHTCTTSIRETGKARGKLT